MGLDVESTAILNDLYEGREVDDTRRARLISLFRLDFADANDMRHDVVGKPVYLAVDDYASGPLGRPDSVAAAKSADVTNREAASPAQPSSR